jgi:hypothetical protein
VSEEVRKLREKSFTKDVLSLQEKRSILGRIARANIATLDVEKDGDLLQEYSEEVDQQGNVRRKKKLPDRIRSIELDARLSGELNGPEQVSVNPFAFLIQLSKTANEMPAIAHDVTPALPSVSSVGESGSVASGSVAIDAELVQDGEPRAEGDHAGEGLPV